MSAIFGIYHLNNQLATRFELERMGEKLTHRGADGAGAWHNGPVGLGHRMLWTTPESLHELLPLKNSAGNAVITADARIDNRDELIRGLRLTDRPAGEISDSELILAAYEEWGEKCPEKLIGDFVFVIWDIRRRVLFIARDPMGVKHFYYYYRPNHIFAFASEIKALLALPEVPHELNELSVADHLLPTYDDKASTLYCGIVRLPANHQATVHPGSLKLQQSWMPDLSYELRLRSDNDYAEAFRDIFTEAVRCRLRSAFPVGSMLSGGLDSSSITCVAGNLMAQDGKGPLHTFSAIWPTIAKINPKIDERRYMSAVTDLGGFDPHYIYADQISPLADREQIFWHQDNSVSAPNMYMDWAIFKAAKEHGVRVLMGGTDGDTTVSYGYEDLAEFVRRGRWLRLAKEVRALKKNMPRPFRVFRRVIWENAFEPLIPEYAIKGWRFMRGRPQADATESARMLPGYCRTRPINQEFAQRIKLVERFFELQNSAGTTDTKNRQWHWNGISSGMWSYILESFEKAGAAQTLELRYPFFDRRLIAFCLSLPPGQRLNGGWTRSILRRAMTGILPPEVQWRTTKGNLSAGVNLKLKEYEQQTLDEAILNSPEIIQDYVDMNALRVRYERYLEDPLRNGDDVFTLMLVINLWLWLRSSGFHYQPIKHQKAV
jgi:asparagine synthase (glutamine-hydrolysing)